MELQTFVEAKESEEPLCWDPWKEERVVESIKSKILMHGRVIRTEEERR